MIVSKFILVIQFVGAALLAQAQFKTAYPDIPRIDVHSHIGDKNQSLSNYLELRELLFIETGIDLAMWINLGTRAKPVVDITKVNSLSEGRVLSSIADYSAHNGLEINPDSLKYFLDLGYTGYKIWSGPWYRALENKEDGFPYIDDKAHINTFKMMEKIGMPGASIHVADPNGPWNERTAWLADPIEYWKEITAWRNLLERHPDLIVVSAHGNWLMCQDAQIDYLRNMLATFPNLNIDLAATFQYFRLVNTENLRAFMIEWADRILYGTDISEWEGDQLTDKRKQQYIRTFQILETDNFVEGGFFDGLPIKGLKLPKEVLAKIYYQNALRIYPGLAQQYENLGYQVE
ncbi:MAG: amidohydrolase family protein [Cyclobacteriaceae bacterium]